YRVHFGRMPPLMHHGNHLGTGCDCGLDERRVYASRSEVDVYELYMRPQQHCRAERRVKGERGAHYFISRTDAEREVGSEKRRGARIKGHGIGYFALEKIEKAFLELFDNPRTSLD